MFLKNNYLMENKYYKLKVNLRILYVLNLSDLFFTKILLAIEPTMFKEANIFLAPVIDGALPYFLKIIVCGGVLYYCKESNEKEMKISIIASRGLLIFYTLINLLHLFNIILILCLK